MVSVKEVPADLLIERLATYLRENVQQVRPPEWAPFVKTGANKERPPMREDWWYVRAASVLRKLYLNGPVGLSRLRTMYGYRAKVGSGMRRERFRKAGGSIIRNILHQLEAAGLVKKGREGRSLTNEGRRLMDKIAAQIARELGEKRPELLKYYSPKTR